MSRPDDPAPAPSFPAELIRVPGCPSVLASRGDVAEAARDAGRDERVCDLLAHAPPAVEVWSHAQVAMFFKGASVADVRAGIHSAKAVR